MASGTGLLTVTDHTWTVLNTHALIQRNIPHAHRRCDP
jgi:hypothetical protein